MLFPEIMSSSPQQSIFREKGFTGASATAFSCSPSEKRQDTGMQPQPLHTRRAFFSCQLRCRVGVKAKEGREHLRRKRKSQY